MVPPERVGVPEMLVPVGATIVTTTSVMFVTV
jgi:hypothetical protein